MIPVCNVQYQSLDDKIFNYHTVMQIPLGCQEINSPGQNSLFPVGEVAGSTSNVKVKYESTSPNTPNSGHFVFI